MNGMSDVEDGKRDSEQESPLFKWEDFEMELTDFERREVTPVVDSLIGCIAGDFLGSEGSGSFLDSMLRQCTPATTSSANRQKAAPLQPKKAWNSQGLERARSAEDGGLIKASYSEPKTPNTSSHMGGRMTLTSMIAEKSSLKRELRAIDIEFELREGRKPTKAEKEHLRPLYVR